MDQLSAFLHSSAWERFQHALGVTTTRLFDELYIERAFSKSRYWQSSRCAISSEWQIPDFARGAVFLRLDPDSFASLENLKTFAHSHHLKLNPTLAFQPRQTTYLNLEGNIEEVLANMKSKHRYNIRVAQKHGVQTEVFSQDLLTHFPRFWKLLSQTADRHEFRTHSELYFESMLTELEKDGMAHLIFATFEGKDIAALLLVTHQRIATYLHGASSTSHKEVMAPYLLHFTAMEEARAAGCTLYDLWGTHAVKDEKGEWQPEAGHASAGTTRFKLGFGGEVLDYPGTYDLVIQNFPYTLYTSIRKIRGHKRAFS